MLEKLRENKWLTLAIVSLGLFIILIDTTVVNVSIPSIIKDLNANLSDVEWIISGYALSFAALLITFGRIGDIYGKRLIFVLGLALFALASLFSGEASNANILIFARLAQGIGGAMISPSVLSIISSTFSGKQRTIAFGVFGAITGVAVAIGPILGGFFTTYYSWRWIFRINIPICAVAIILSLIFIRENAQKIKERLDVSGMILSTIGFFLLVFGLIEGQTYGWIKPSKDFILGSFKWPFTSFSVIFASFILSALILITFVFIELYKTHKNLEPAINIDFFKYKTYRYGLIAIAVIALGEFSSLFTLPIFLQSVRGLTALQSGVATLPLALASFIAAPLSARLVNKLGSKWIITTGIVFECIGLLLLSLIEPSTSVVQLIIPFAILGTGIGLAVAQNTQVILSEIPVGNSGSASGVLNTIRQVGSALGIAIIGAVLASSLNTNISNQINKIPDIPTVQKTAIITQAQKNNNSIEGGSQSFSKAQVPPQIAANPIALQRYEDQIAHIEDEIKNAVFTSLTDSIASSIRVGAVFMLIGAFLSLFIPTVKHGDENIEEKILD